MRLSSCARSNKLPGGISRGLRPRTLHQVTFSQLTGNTVVLVRSQKYCNYDASCDLRPSEAELPWNPLNPPNPSVDDSVDSVADGGDESMLPGVPRFDVPPLRFVVGIWPNHGLRPYNIGDTLDGYVPTMVPDLSYSADMEVRELP